MLSVINSIPKIIITLGREAVVGGAADLLPAGEPGQGGGAGGALPPQPDCLHHAGAGAALQPLRSQVLAAGRGAAQDR